MGTACFQGDRSLSSRSKRSESGPCREAPRGPVRERPHTWQRMPVSAGLGGSLRSGLLLGERGPWASTDGPPCTCVPRVVLAPLSLSQTWSSGR